MTVDEYRELTLLDEDAAKAYLSNLIVDGKHSLAKELWKGVLAIRKTVDDPCTKKIAFEWRYDKDFTGLMKKLYPKWRK